MLQGLFSASMSARLSGGNFASVFRLASRFSFIAVCLLNNARWVDLSRMIRPGFSAVGILARAAVRVPQRVPSRGRDIDGAPRALATD